MPQKRKPENRGLPARWVYKHGAYYYLPPPDMRYEWDDKSWFLLGKTLPDAYKTWADRISAPERITTVSALLDRFAMEVIPTKAPKTRTEYQRYVAALRKPFGEVKLADIEPQHIYQYVDRRSAKIAADARSKCCRPRLPRLCNGD